jgi:hypothetical protein
MKPAKIERPIGLDRLATWNEIRCAMLVSSKNALGVAARDDFFDEADSHLYGPGCNLPEDFAWLDIVREMPDSLSN